MIRISNKVELGVADSAVADSDILIFDDCGRFIPIYKDDIEELIEMLEDFIPIPNEEATVNPNDITTYSLSKLYDTLNAC